MRAVILLAVGAMTLAACGGGSERVSRYSGGPSVSFASGPISAACLRSDRKAANSRLCGCVQGVANQRLSGADQRLAARFFRDPHQAQEVKMSKTDRDDAFWDRYTAFAAAAERSCTGY